MHIVIVGLGYVGLPLAVEIARHFDATGLDIDAGRVEQLKTGHDRTNEVESEKLRASTLKLTADPADCAGADVYIVTVPTPIDDDKKPDLGPVIGATKGLSKLIDPAKKPVIVYESTVYPGVTEDICGPLIEAETGLEQGRDFFLGYSPERINPGDREHTVDRITKVIAGENDEVTETLATIYGKVTSGGVYRAASIRVAEAAKVIENAQRDINIAFMNELARIFDRMDISIWDVLGAAGTKWNFLPFQPGLVGGHCIGVDPYYLSHRAQELDYDPQVILSGRALNDSMGDWVAQTIDARCNGKPARTLVLGLSFKENVPDLRNSKVVDVIAGLKDRGHEVVIHDPLVDPAEAAHEYGLTVEPRLPSGPFGLVVLAVPHKAFIDAGASKIGGLVGDMGLLADLKNALPAAREDSRFGYWSL